MAKTKELDLRFTGDFSFVQSITLAERAGFADRLRPVEGSIDDNALDLAFAIEGSWNTVGIRVVERRGKLLATVFANPDKVSGSKIQAHLERMFSLDSDGVAYKAICLRDKVVSELVSQRSGIRPILFRAPTRRQHGRSSAMASLSGRRRHCMVALRPNTV